MADFLLCLNPAASTGPHIPEAERWSHPGVELLFWRTPTPYPGGVYQDDSLLLCWLGEARLEPSPDGPPSAEQATDFGALLAQAWRRWGEQLPQRIEGHCCFCVWEWRRQTLFCSRDRFGFMPVWISGLGQRCTRLTTRPDAGLLAIGLQPNIERLNAWLWTHNDASRDDFLRGVQRIHPGEWLCIERHRSRFVRYWSPPPQTASLTSIPEAVASTERLLRRSLAALGPPELLCFTLSGGMDSTTLVALFAEQVQATPERPVCCATMVSERWPSLDERGQVGTTAQRLPLRTMFFSVDEHWTMSGEGRSGMGLLAGPSISLLLDSLDPFYRAVASEHRRIVTGDGGDFLFAPSRQDAMRLLFNGSFAQFAHRYRWDWRLMLKVLVRHGLEQLPVGEYCREVVWRTLGSQESYTQRTRWLQMGPPRTMSCEDALWFTGPIWESRIRIYDHLARRHGVTLLHPYFESSLVELCATFAPHLRSLDQVQKPVLREMMRHRLPDSIRLRAKQGHFLQPVAFGLRRERELLFQLARNMRLEDCGLLNGQKFLRQYQAFLLSQDSFASWASPNLSPIGQTLAAEIWLRRFEEGPITL
jgi:asparagine synthetase B (glutamine-hydrolysing)